MDLSPVEEMYPAAAGAKPGITVFSFTSKDGLAKGRSLAVKFWRGEPAGLGCLRRADFFTQAFFQRSNLFADGFDPGKSPVCSSSRQTYFCFRRSWARARDRAPIAETLGESNFSSAITRTHAGERTPSILIPYQNAPRSVKLQFNRLLRMSNARRYQLRPSCC